MRETCWCHRHYCGLESTEVRDAGVRAAEVPELALPDALAADPRRLVAAAEAIVHEARQKGAPSDVTSTLEESLVKMRAGAQNLERYEYTLRTLANMQGLRDRFELEPVLERALADAPDDGNREKLEMMLSVVRRPSGIDLLALGPIGPLSISCDWGCCAFSCIMCWSGCIICCAAACLLC